MLKTGSNWNFFLTNQDCGLIIKKRRGSLANKPGRTGISGCGPLDHDLADQIGSAHVLIWAAVSRSGGQGQRARGVAAEGRRRRLAAAEQHRREPIRRSRGPFGLPLGRGWSARHA